MIREIVSYKTIRLLNIAEKIIVYRKVLHIDDIKEMNDCSTKTAYDDIYHIKNWENNRLKIDFGNKECKSKSSSIGDLIAYKQNLFQRESLMVLLLNIYFHPERNIVDHAVELNYSEAHTRIQISKLNKFLKKFDLKIIYLKDNNSYDIQSPCQFKLALFISEIIKMSNLYEFIESGDLYQTCKGRYQTSSMFLSHHLLLSKIFKTKKISYRNFYSNCDIALIDSSLKEELSLLNKKLNILVSEKSEAYLLDILVLISLKSLYFPEKLDSFVNRYDMFAYQLIDENPEEIKVFNQALINISKKTDINLMNYKNDIFFYMYTMVREVREHKTYTIGVYSDLGREHALALKLSCEKHFPMHNFELYKKI